MIEHPPLVFNIFREFVLFCLYGFLVNVIAAHEIQRIVVIYKLMVELHDVTWWQFVFIKINIEN